MKKLALALVCLVSVAFFASCTPEGEPTIYVLNEQGYVKDGDTVQINDTVSFGFVMSSSLATNKGLTSLVVKVDDNEQWDVVDLTGQTEYTYRAGIIYRSAREYVRESIITAVVTDEAGQIATVSFTLHLNQPEQPQQPLEVADFSWFRHGNNPGEGLAEYGLEWKGNAKEVFAVIKPVEGATLYGFSPDTWDEVVTDADKTAAFTEGLHTIMDDFRGVSAWSTKDYDFVIGTLYNGEYHMIHITRGVVDSSAAGTDITITGQAK